MESCINIQNNNEPSLINSKKLKNLVFKRKIEETKVNFFITHKNEGFFEFSNFTVMDYTYVEHTK